MTSIPSIVQIDVKEAVNQPDRGGRFMGRGGGMGGRGKG